MKETVIFEIREYGATADPLGVTRIGTIVRKLILKYIHKMCIFISERCFQSYMIMWKYPKLPTAKEMSNSEEQFQIMIHLYCSSGGTRKKIKRNEMLWIKNLDHNFCNLKGGLSPINNF